MLKQLLIISDSNRYRSLFIALTDLGIKAERIPSDNNVPLPSSTKSYAAVLMDWDPSSSRRMERLKEIHGVWPNLPIVVLDTGSGAGAGSSGQIGKLADHLVMTGDENENLARLLDSFHRIAPELRG